MGAKARGRADEEGEAGRILESGEATEQDRGMRTAKAGYFLADKPSMNAMPAALCFAVLHEVSVKGLIAFAEDAPR